MSALRIYETYKVISHSERDGMHVDHFESASEARAFAKNAAEAGFDCIVCKVFEAFEAEDQDIDLGVAAGVDFPATLSA